MMKILKKTDGQMEQENDLEETEETRSGKEIFEDLVNDFKELTKQSKSYENIFKNARVLLGTEEEIFVMGDKEYTRGDIADIIETYKVEKQELDEEIEMLQKLIGHAYFFADEQ